MPAQTADADTAAAAHVVGNPPIPPPPTPPRSPVEFFRELLVMPPAERQRSLAGRSPENRKLILEKIREYKALSPEQCELRLAVTELRWYLRPLLNVPAKDRAARLEAMPSDIRKEVEDRLRMWDLLPPNLQQEVLQNEATARYFSEIAAGYPAQPNGSTNITTWAALSEDKRREIAQLFESFFGLRPEEQAKVLESISPAESRQIEKTLETYQHLPARERAQCIRSFEKFASLSPQARQQFLRNAQKWEQMSPSDRQVFREIVERAYLQPPMPMSAPIPPPPRPLTPRLPDTATNK